MRPEKAVRRLKKKFRLASKTVEVPSGGPRSLKTNIADVEENQ